MDSKRSELLLQYVRKFALLWYKLLLGTHYHHTDTMHTLSIQCVFARNQNAASPRDMITITLPFFTSTHYFWINFTFLTKFSPKLICKTRNYRFSMRFSTNERGLTWICSDVLLYDSIPNTKLGNMLIDISTVLKTTLKLSLEKFRRGCIRIYRTEGAFLKEYRSGTFQDS